jgi:hypothetical protein
MVSDIDGASMLRRQREAVRSFLAADQGRHDAEHRERVNLQEASAAIEAESALKRSQIAQERSRAVEAREAAKSRLAALGIAWPTATEMASRRSGVSSNPLAIAEALQESMAQLSSRRVRQRRFLTQFASGVLVLVVLVLAILGTLKFAKVATEQPPAKPKTVAQSPDAERVGKPIERHAAGPPPPDPSGVVVATLEIRSSDGAELRLDGRSLGLAPQTITVEPGHYVVTSRKQSCTAAEESVTLIAGEHRSLELKPKCYSAGEFIKMARTNFALGSYEAALDWCDAALKLEPHNSAALDLKAKIEKTLQVIQGK